MSLNKALQQKREELEVLNRRQSLSDLRMRADEQEAARPLTSLFPQTTPSALEPTRTKSGLFLPPEGSFRGDGELNPFSIEALIEAELQEKLLDKLAKPPEPPVLPELKRRSLPSSKSRVAPRPPPPAVQTYGPQLATHPPALVIWTDRFYYNGLPDDLAGVRQWYHTQEEVELPPILVRADLIIDPYQLYQTRALGADALLFITAAVVPNQLEDLLGLCQELRLTPLLYATSWAEVVRGLKLDQTLFVMGEGDLFDREARQAAGAGALKGIRSDLPPNIRVLSWGGISSLDEYDQRARLGADGMIIGRGWPRVQQALEQRSDRHP